MVKTGRPVKAHRVVDNVLVFADEVLCDPPVPLGSAQENGRDLAKSQSELDPRIRAIVECLFDHIHVPDAASVAQQAVAFSCLNVQTL